jgi:hypothetical protein
MTDFTRTFSDIDVNETTGVVRRLSGTYTLGTASDTDRETALPRLHISQHVSACGACG